jgi:hypothetical protein
MSNLMKRLYGKRLKNSKIYREFQDIGFDYILNPVTQELHLVGLDNFLGSHNLLFSNSPSLNIITKIIKRKKFLSYSIVVVNSIYEILICKL